MPLVQNIHQLVFKVGKTSNTSLMGELWSVSNDELRDNRVIPALYSGRRTTAAMLLANGIRNV